MALTFNGPSTRGVPRPIGETVGASCVVGIFAPSVESACRRHLEGVREAAFGQLNLERVLALRFGVPQRRFRGCAKAGWIGRLFGECRFSLSGSSALGAHTTPIP